MNAAFRPHHRPRRLHASHRNSIQPPFIESIDHTCNVPEWRSEIAFVIVKTDLHARLFRELHQWPELTRELRQLALHVYELILPVPGPYKTGFPAFLLSQKQVPQTDDWRRSIPHVIIGT